MFTRASLVSLILFTSLAVSQQPGPDEVGPRRKDSYGDPLPAGAAARLGTTRLHKRHSMNLMRFTPDSRFLVCFEWGQDWLDFWDRETGTLAEVAPFSLLVGPVHLHP